MNCKQGDLALVMKSWAGNEGKIVRCLNVRYDVFFRLPCGRTENVEAWEVDQNLVTYNGKQSNIIQDYRLKPLRDNPGQDETLTWAPVPKKVEA